MHALSRLAFQELHCLTYFLKLKTVIIGGICCIVFSGEILAETSSRLSPEPLDNLGILKPNWNNQAHELNEQQKAILDAQTEKTKHANVELSDEDLKKNPQFAEIIIQTAIQRRDWTTVEQVLAIYKQHPQHDEMLVFYAQGGLLRYQGHYQQAIAQYREMLERDASLDYVRFDLGVMFFENKQYRDAERQLQATRDNPQVSQEFRALSEQFLKQVSQRERINSKVKFRLLHNDNVNQATDNVYLEIGNLILKKDPRYMPKSSVGSNYALSLEQDYNIKTNHFISWSTSVDGLNYASAHDFDEHAINADLQYKWQNAKSWFYIGPSFEWRWLDQTRYLDNYGIAASAGHWLSPRWQASLYTRWSDKSYKNSAYAAYNGNTLTISPTLVYLWSPKTAIFAGIIGQQENLKLDSESFKQYGVNFGLSKEWDNGINVLTQIQWARRHYNKNNPVFQYKREDDRLNAVLSLGYKKFNFMGVEPKLSFQMDDVDSNIDALYSRVIKQWILSFEKKF
ncbi:surface lipoprotein assembly modifier [Acinetobacter larvae]|uniref:Uncharacterized protein n=1 Tax=Acinetobacter larvae TaxID=1789224 RepID=A0A1B2LXZ2_9GAMM|nr:surface lipoprotein assembly modifier [Acinetobacter larvae]AOA57749.1 hypothetical protein BFG52_04845 [Acinetobacter larvae]